MTAQQFVHLRLHSEFSIVDGIVRLDDGIEHAVNYEMGALALTDLSNIFGLIKFYTGARKAGVKPIMGVDIWISNQENPEQAHRGLLLVKNNRGYLNLCELMTRATLDNQNLERSEIDSRWFLQNSSSAEAQKNPFKLNEGLIFLSGAMAGDVGIALTSNRRDLAEKFAQQWELIFPGNFYLEVQRTGVSNEEFYIQEVTELAARLQIPIVATHPIQFISKEDFNAHEIRVCIADGQQLGNPKRLVRFTPEQYFKSPQEMVELFKDIPSAIANSIEIAKRCNLSLQLGIPRLPDFPIPEGKTLAQFLMEEALVGLEKRLIQLYSDLTQRELERSRYVERLQFEVNTIIQMGFPGYFLIVADFIHWAKNNGVPVGPGRGSGAGSLVAYSLGITDLDPLKYNLLFERFLNPERVSMPDFDIDFCQQGRDKVIQYVKDKYGEESVSQIATFGTMAAKGAIRDVGRVIEQPYPFVDSISKLIEAKPGQQITISEAISEKKELAERVENEEDVRQLIELAQQLEGITRNVGMHAGGVLIAPGKLTDFCPLYKQSGKDPDSTGVISQFDKYDVEEVGLVKFDFLGLTTLTILELAQQHIRKLYSEMSQWDLTQVPLDDEATFDLLKKANTVAVFQLESRGMQNMLHEAKPDRFEDIIALVALFRPGPMDLIPSYIKRKHGEEIVIYPDERVRPVLEETYGIMVYQEQVMQMAQLVGGYSLGSADLLRRAMGKKKPEEMAEQSKIFVAGAMKSGLSEVKAEEIFEQMAAFAGYGFNKSHAAAYALLAYHTAWLKTHYIAEFMAANLSLAMDDIDKVKILYEDAHLNGVQITPPDINIGEYKFIPVRETVASPKIASRKIHFGLGAIRGTGENAINEIVRARGDQSFSDLFDFCLRVNRKITNRRAVEALIRAGAFDSIAPGGVKGRAILIASLPNAIQAADQAQADINQSNLFSVEGESSDEAPEYTKAAFWLDKKRLQEEKAALGFCISGHLFDGYRDELKHFIHQPLSQLKPSSGEKLLAGIITAQRTIRSSNGTFTIIQIDDGTNQVELSLSEDVYTQYRECFRDDELLIAKVMTKVRPANENFGGSVRHFIQAAMNIATARLRYAKSIHFQLKPDINLHAFQEKTQVFMLGYQDPHVKKAPDRAQHQGLPLTADLLDLNSVCQISFPENFKVYPDDNNLQGFNAALNILGIHEQLEVLYH